MSFNNVPVNGWPQIKELEKLDALAKQIENMPTFTSADKAFLEDLPGYPDTDGTKMLTATTESGETSLSYEDIPEELPADPQSDGTRVLTATTSSGETVKSWEAIPKELPADPQSDGTRVLTATTSSGTTVKSWEPPQSMIDYSTTEQETGQKWIDNSPVYSKTYNNIQLTDSTDVVVDNSFGSDKNIINLECIAYAATEQIPISSFSSSGSKFAYPFLSNGALKIVVNGDMTSYKARITVYYTKTPT